MNDMNFGWSVFRDVERGRLSNPWHTSSDDRKTHASGKLQRNHADSREDSNVKWARRTRLVTRRDEIENVRTSKSHLSRRRPRRPMAAAGGRKGDQWRWALLSGEGSRPRSSCALRVVRGAGSASPCAPGPSQHVHTVRYDSLSFPSSPILGSDRRVRAPTARPSLRA